VSKFSGQSLFGSSGRSGTVTVIDQRVHRNYARRAMVTFFVVGPIVALLTATVASHYMHPVLGALLGIVIGAVIGFLVALVVFIWPVLRMFWWWALEITLTTVLVFGWTWLMQATNLTLSLVIVGCLAGLLAGPAPVRNRIRAIWWCVIVRHRLRVAFNEFIITNRHGSLPLILWAKPTPAGERVWVFLRPGLAVSDLEGRTDKLAVSCWATEVRVAVAGRRAAVLRVDVTRRNPLAEKVTSPLPGVVRRTWDALNRRNGTNHQIPTNAPTSPGMPPANLDLADVTDADIEDLMPPTRERKPRNPRRSREDFDNDDDSFGSNNADWA
jgi:hypothetical protein